MGISLARIAFITLWAHFVMGNPDAPTMGSSSDEPQLEILNEQLVTVVDKYRYTFPIAVCCLLAIFGIVSWGPLRVSRNISNVLARSLRSIGSSNHRYLEKGKNLSANIRRRLILLCFAISTICSFMTCAQKTKTRIAIGALLKDVGALRKDVGALRNDIGTMGNDMDTIINHVDTMRNDVDTMRNDIGTMRNDTGIGITRNELNIKFGALHNDLVSMNAALKNALVIYQQNHQAKSNNTD
jgi:hypothetical protein